MDYQPKIRNTIDLPSAYWNAIHTGMRRVVMKKSYYTDLGVNVAGKTGTAQENKKRANHALFVSYAPYENPEITVTVQIPNGYTSGNAAELASNIYKYYYDKSSREALLKKTVSLPALDNDAVRD